MYIHTSYTPIIWHRNVCTHMYMYIYIYIYIFQGEPLVQHFLSNTGFLQKWRRMRQIMALLDTTENIYNERGRIVQVALDKCCHPVSHDYYYYYYH